MNPNPSIATQIIISSLEYFLKKLLAKIERIVNAVLSKKLIK
jgi:hypothetical protein